MSDLSTVQPNDDQFNDCPVLNKTRIITSNRGVKATVKWPFRNRNGETVDLSEYLGACDSSSSESSESCGSVVFRFYDIYGCQPNIFELDGEAVDAENGVVKTCLSQRIYDQSGIWAMEIGVKNADGDLVATDKGYLSIERGLFGSIAGVDKGPPTIGEIRMQLRDRVIENDLLDDVEFDDAEIVHSILRPINEWNELPPPLNPISPSEFPFRDHWINAIVANLMRIAAVWMERNNLSASHGGVSTDERSRAKIYWEIANQLRQEWLEFVKHKKIEINASMAYGSLNSTYLYRSYGGGV